MVKKKDAALSPEERLQQAHVPEKEWPYELPKEWKWVRTGDINCYQGISITPADSKNKLFELYSVPSFDGNYPEIIEGKDIGSSKQTVEVGDVLLCKINPRINRVWYVTGHTKNQLVASSEWIVIRNNRIEPRYLMYCLRAQYFRQLLLSNVSGVGGSLMRAQPKFVKNYPIPIAPYSVQVQIADFLDREFARLNEAQEQIQSVIDSAEERKQSILYKAMTGDLSARWRKENGYSLEEWDRCSVNDICRDIKVGIVIKPTRYYTDSSGIPAFRSANVREFHVQDSDWVYINEQGQRENQRTIVHTNDVLIVRSGNPGTACVVPKKFDGCNAIDIIIAVPDQSVIDPDYLCIFTNSPIGHGQIKSGVRGMALTHFNVTSYGKLEIAVPSLAEQHEIVHLVKQYLEKEKTVEETAMSVLNQLETTRQAILNKAFRGELVC